MATVGDQLKQPEVGWRRYDDTHVDLKYTGSWYKVTSTNYYNGSVNVTTRAADNNYVAFSFYGTKVRIISDIAQDRHSDNTITVDGVTESFNTNKSGTAVLNAIVYEKMNLPLGFHTVTIMVGHNRTNFIMDAIDIDESGYLYGYTLTAPEAGWRRFDDTYNAFAYLGANWIAYTGANQGIYNNTHHYTSQGKGDTEIRFKFYGTKLRLISSIGPAFANDISVIIDGVTEKFNPRMPTTADERQKVTYEKTNLPLGVHEVNLISGTNGDWRLDIDAVDIDENGYLVARVGQQLTTPEPEWKRYDTDNNALYLGTDWKTVVNATGRAFEGGSVKYSNVIGNYIKFSFTGKKLRLIAEYHNLYDPNVEVSIDGVVEYINLSTTSSSYQPQRLVLDKINLSDGSHEVVVKKISGTGNFHIDAVDIDVTGRMIRYIGSQLTTPDEGWKRYDNNSVIKYEGLGWVSATGDANTYAGTAHYLPLTDGATSNSIKFNFYGTKLRIIDLYWTNRVNNVTIEIDGEISTWNPNNPANMYQVLVFEASGLAQGLHKVKLSTSSSSGTFSLDAIDIDADGRLFHPDEVTSIAELEIGKRIRCHYQSSSANTVGAFSGLGKQLSDFIPITSTTTPNGDFYFIMVEDWNGRKLLVADRLIQIISWDSINANGMVGGTPISLGEYKEIATSIRLLTGGINSTDKDNEWDKYIVNSTLDGKITAGDNSVWNWSGGYSWTSSTNTYASTNRTVRGSSKVDFLTYTISSNASHGFRPLMEVEILPMDRSFINHDGAYKKYTPKVIIESNDNAIPTMTSNTSPSGVASASSIFVGASIYEPWKAFDGTASDGSDAWATENGKVAGWLAYKFTSPINIYKYSITSRNSADTGAYSKESAPKKWTFEGSSDGVNWTVLDSRSNVTGWSINETRSFELEEKSISSFAHYRINISENNGWGNFTTVAELKLFEITIVSIRGWNTISATLPSEDAFINDGMGDLSVLDRKNENFVQTMTANGALGSGKLFKGSIDLKKYFEITNVSVKWGLNALLLFYIK